MHTYIMICPKYDWIFPDKLSIGLQYDYIYPKITLFIFNMAGFVQNISRLLLNRMRFIKLIDIINPEGFLIVPLLVQN